MKIKPDVGMEIQGYCEGVFGRDFYGMGRFETVAYDYVVLRDELGTPIFARTYDGSEFMIEEDWVEDETR